MPSEEIQIAFRDKIIDLIEQVKGNGDKFYFLDPMHQIHNNANGYGWQFIGAGGTKQVKSNTGRRRLNIIGALDPLSFEPLIILTEANCNKELMIAYLKHIRENNLNSKLIYVVLDNATYNRSYAVQDTANSLGIELIYLPPYCPNLNLIERLWKFFKKKVIKNTYYETFEKFYHYVNRFFANILDYTNELKSLLTLNFGIIKTC